MPAGHDEEFRKKAARYARLAEEATTETVRRHLLARAQNYEALAPPAPRATRSGRLGGAARAECVPGIV